MYDVHASDPTTGTGLSLPPLEEALRAETEAEGKANEAEMAVAVAPTRENLNRLADCLARQVVAANQLGMCIARALRIGQTA